MVDFFVIIFPYVTFKVTCSFAIWKFFRKRL